MPARPIAAPTSMATSAAYQLDTPAAPDWSLGLLVEEGLLSSEF